jgi:hypothetical protein
VVPCRACPRSQRHYLRRGVRRERRFAGLAGLVAQQTFNPALGKALLPPPHRRPADADGLRPLRRMPIRRGEHDARPLDVLARPVAVARDRRQLLALRGAQYHTYLLCHGGPNPYSLIKLKNSLIARFHSLLGGKKYPVRSGRELARKPLNSVCEFTALPAPHSAAERNSLYFPG